MMVARDLAVAWAAFVLFSLLFACASQGSRPPHPDLAAVWRSYRELPAVRALAVAGDPGRDRWVAGASGGHASRSDAEAQALVECGKRRAARRLRAACVLYAVDDEIVWPGR